MKLKDQVISLSIAKRLYKLGVHGTSALWWRNDYPNNTDKYPDVWWLESDNDYPYTGRHTSIKYDAGFHLLSAFTSSEIGVMLPECDCANGHIDGRHFYPNYFRTKFKERNKRWVIGDNYPLGKAHVDSIFHGKSEVEVKAKLLIYLIENSIIFPEEVNARLNGR